MTDGRLPHLVRLAADAYKLTPADVVRPKPKQYSHEALARHDIVWVARSIVPPIPYRDIAEALCISPGQARHLWIEARRSPAFYMEIRRKNLQTDLNAVLNGPLPTVSAVEGSTDTLRVSVPPDARLGTTENRFETRGDLLVSRPLKTALTPSSPTEEIHAATVRPTAGDHVVFSPGVYAGADRLEQRKPRSVPVDRLLAELRGLPVVEPTAYNVALEAMRRLRTAGYVVVPSGPNQYDVDGRRMSAADLIAKAERL